MQELAECKAQWGHEQAISITLSALLQSAQVSSASACVRTKQELAEAKAHLEHKQAKARAQWHQTQAKPTQGRLFKSVMGDRELFYQVSRDDAGDEDDAPVIKHSPLVEEQLAAARA
eukprot:1158387-Pelagomonas_calceolata.AAC.7